MLLLSAPVLVMPDFMKPFILTIENLLHYHFISDM